MTLLYIIAGYLVFAIILAMVGVFVVRKQFESLPKEDPKELGTDPVKKIINS